MGTPRPIVAIAIAIAASIALTAPAVGSATAPVERPRKVVVFGVDGLLFDKIAPAAAPTLDSLIASGRSSRTWLYADPMAPTLSGPGWATNATGVWPDKHRVTSNDWGSGTNLAQYPDFLTRLERADRAFSTYAISDWAPLTSATVGPAVFGGEIDTRETVSDAPGYLKADATTAAKAAAHLKNTGPDASFVYFGEVDIAGHDCGAATACYRTAIENTDRNLGTVVDAIRSRPTYAAEDWTILVTTDHGHLDTGGHGGSTPAERSSFIIQVGPGVPAGTMPVRPKNVDIAATVLAVHGVTAPLDGQVLGTPVTDPFDTATLGPRVDETGIPASVLGWTRTPPSGWGVDNAGMGTGGVTEWRGWALTNDDFWTRTQPGQQRESNVRARGVFAVADSDEWSDKATTGSFTSALVSPAHTVTGKSAAIIGFGSHHLKDGGETATVSVSFDGGADRTVLAYTGDAIARVERLSVPVPAGANRMVVKWRLSNGVNNWYWAVDNPTVTLT